MDLKGSLVDTNVRIYPSPKLLDFIQTLSPKDDLPDNFLQFIKRKFNLNKKQTEETEKPILINLDSKDLEDLKQVKLVIKKIESTKSLASESVSSSENDIEESKSIRKDDDPSPEKDDKKRIDDQNKGDCNTSEHEKDLLDKETIEKPKVTEDGIKDGPYLLTSDLDWLYIQLKKQRSSKEVNVPYLHELLEGSEIVMPENKIIKRNPVLEARCVKLRAQQEAREYRKMTKGVDNVRLRFPEDSISYQLKHLNRQLIAVGQFILSIFAGFLFGFKGVEWMIGTLDFGFRLLLGVMCALVIALAEIYFLAKKLNEEMNVPETVQLGGPPKFVDESMKNFTTKDKEHQD